MSCVKSDSEKNPTLFYGGELDFNPATMMQPRKPLPTPKDRRNGADVKSSAIPPTGFYRPNYNMLTPHMRSPEYVQMSTAAAITLGIMQGKMHRCELHALPQSAAHLSRGLPRELRLLRARAPPRGRARTTPTATSSASTGRPCPWRRSIDIVARDGAKSPFHRMCISMITHPRSDADTVTRAEGLDRAHRPEQRFRSRSCPIPTTMTRDDVERLHGARRRHLHRRARRGDAGDLRPHARQGRAVAAHLAQVLGDPDGRARDLRPEKFGAHIIVGMGETEHDVLRSCSGSSTSAATATCSASSPRRAR